MPTEGRRAVYVSGGWQLDLARRELREEGTLVPLGSRAFDLLEMMVQSAGELVTKNDLMAQVWRGSAVEENALQFHISAIRKAFGKNRDMVKTVSGQGYRLLGDWAVRPESAADEPVVIRRVPYLIQPIASNFPTTGSELIGRSIAVQRLRDLLSSCRTVTLTGPGGIGKSKLALQVAHSLLPSFEGDVWLVELASLSDPDLVPSSVAGALGLKLGGNEISASAIARAIGARKVLILLDNCEHVVDAAARLTETLVRQCPRATIVTTSREILGTESEHVYRVLALDVPSHQARSQEAILQCSAVQLFVTRIEASDHHLELNEESLATIAAICRRLDGIPLAIEFAAARVASLGLQEVLPRLDDRFRLLSKGSRTAPPRHQTLHATLDWSYQLLQEADMVLLRRLAIFATGFTLDAAVSIVGDIDVPIWSVEEGITNLVVKSLIAVDIASVPTRYWLLETTRAYAREKLSESCELALVARRHAEYHRDLFEKAEGDLEVQSTDEWLAVYGRLVDELRVALDWAFSPGGDWLIGVAVTAASASLWLQLTLLAEFRRRLERALSISSPGSEPPPRLQMQLLAALGVTLLFTSAPVQEIRATWKRVREIADRLENPQYQLRALQGLWEIALNRGEFRETLTLAQDAYAMAARVVDPATLPTIHRLIGVSLHYLGDQAGARRNLEQILAYRSAAPNRSRARGTHIDPQVSGRSALARVYWLLGYPDQAARMANTATVKAQDNKNALSLCFAITWAAFPVALFSGDLTAAEAAVEILLDVSAEHKAGIYHMWGRRCQASLLVRKGDAEGGVSALRHALNTFRERGLTLAYTSTMCDLAEALGLTGHAFEGLAVIEEALVRCERIEERWCFAELLRLKGTLLQLEGGPQAAVVAEDHFLQCLDWARRQKELSWELRGAMSLAQLWRQRAQGDKARALLAEVYGRFTEGFATADLKSAKALLDELS